MKWIKKYFQRRRLIRETERTLEQVVWAERFFHTMELIPQALLATVGELVTSTGVEFRRKESPREQQLKTRLSKLKLKGIKG